MKMITKKNIKKIIFLTMLVILLVCFLKSCIPWIVSDQIHCAAVDETTGNVSLLNLDYEILTFDKNGTLLYSRRLQNTTGGYGSLYYSNGELHVQAYRTNLEYVLNERGETINDMTYDVDDRHLLWVDWTETKEGYEYVLGTTIYRYNYPSFVTYLFHKDETEISFVIVDTKTQSIVNLWNFYE